MQLIKLTKYQPLIDAALEAKGDTQKQLPISKYFNDPPNNIENKKFDDLVTILNENDLIRVCSDHMFRLTPKGYYYAIETSGLSANNFEMVSYDEAKELGISLLMDICKKKYNDINTIKIDTILFNNYEKKITFQILDVLYDENLIDYADGNYREIQITNKGVSRIVEYILRK